MLLSGSASRSDRGRVRWVGGSLAAVVALGFACGARSGLDSAGQGQSGSAATTTCRIDADCVSDDACLLFACIAGICEVRGERQCDQSDPCVPQRCVPESGECRSFPRTFDLDGDGHRGPLPGFTPGAVGACGDDCDDTSPLAFPGGVEMCDGLDNDCNGVVDDGAEWLPDPATVVRVSAPGLQALPGGIAHDGENFGLVYHEVEERWQNLFRALRSDGVGASQASRVTFVGNDTFSGPLRWTGATYATVWEDRRDSDYEIYFNRLDRSGRPFGPDVRVSSATGFSLHPDLLWTGEHFVVVWDDERSGGAQLYGRLFAYDGTPVTLERPLSEGESGAESPRLAQTSASLALAFKIGGVAAEGVALRTLSADLERLGSTVVLAADRAVEPTLAAAGERYFVAWHTRSGRGPGPAIWGAAVAADGSVVVQPRPLTSEAVFARGKSWVALGDRLLLVWAADYGDGYDLYAKLLDTELRGLGEERRVTRGVDDTASPIAAIGAQGDVGILFRDRREGPWQVYYTRLVCAAGG